ncbi:MAG: hypothetical protein A2W22_04250 [Candidatus Levybacteria bacterium RBG_16_35_11]|nr:MAG: hypothetical protein A2W22_04250 [Candidatus Levybacteria bacterium RBG_16_35_11]
MGQTASETEQVLTRRNEGLINKRGERVFPFNYYRPLTHFLLGNLEQGERVTITPSGHIEALPRAQETSEV